METLKQQHASRHGKGGRGSVGEDEVREMVKRPDYTWPGSNGRRDFCSKWNRRPLESYKQRSEITCIIKMITVSGIKKLPGRELDKD